MTAVVIVPWLLVFALHSALPDWSLITVAVAVTVAVSLVLLPVAKAVFIALIWRQQAQRSRRRSSGES